MISLTVNGREHRLDVEPTTPLLYVLRDALGLNGAKYGCGLGQCGACAAIVDGRAVLSCVVPVSALAGRKVTTLEGLGTPERPGPVQQAFIDEQAAQCGYCIPGMIVAAHALLQANADADEVAIRRGLQGHLCRCGTHMRILRAVRRAAAALKGGATAAAAAPSGGRS